MSDGGRPSAARRVLWPALFIVAFAAFVVVAVFPTRTYLDQRASTADAEARLDEVVRQNDALQARVDALQTDEEVERLAREEYGLVKPGEEAYHILPPAEDPIDLPDVWPLERLDDRLGGN